MNNIEKNFIIEIIRFNTNKEKIEEMIKSNKINWINVLGFISYHRIAGLVYEKMNSINIRLLDFPVFFSIYMINQAQKCRNKYQLNEIKKISQKFEQNKIKYVFLKGSILNHTVFESGTRSSNDIDVLISKDSIETATEILNNLGYTQGKYNYKQNTIKKFSDDELKESLELRGETCPFVKITDKTAIKTIDVDLNFSLDWTPDYNQELIDEVLNNRIKIRLDKNNIIYSASIYDNIIELCTHLYKDMALIDIVKKRKVFDLYKFIDIYYYINLNYKNINFKTLKEKIISFAAEQYVYFSLKYLSEIFDDFNNEEIVDLMIFLQKFIEPTNILDTIFDQYNEDKRLVTTLNIRDRIFEYNIIDKYKGE